MIHVGHTDNVQEVQHGKSRETRGDNHLSRYCRRCLQHPMRLQQTKRSKSRIGSASGSGEAVPRVREGPHLRYIQMADLGTQHISRQI